MEDQFDFSAQP